jgi:CRP/FNR family transcriptional regulator, cyclic AMP receptor protein
VDTKIYIFDRESRTINFKAGDTIFKAGDPATVLYVIQDGEVEIMIAPHHTDVLGPGEFFGEMSLMSHEPRSATAIAKTDVRLVPVDEKRFTFMVQETPNFALTVMRVMASRLRTENRALSEALTRLQGEIAQSS